MKDVYIDLSPQIIKHAQDAGRDINPDEIVSLDQALNFYLDVDPITLKLGFYLGFGSFGTLEQALDLLTSQPKRIAA